MIIEQPSVWQWMLLIGLLLICSFAVRLTLQHRPYPVAANTLAMLAYLGIFLAISGLILQPKIADTVGQVVTLHLPDADPMPVLPKGDNISLGVNPHFPDMSAVMSLEALSVIYPTLSQLQLNGAQFPLSEVAQLNVESISVMQNAPKQGFSQLNWQKQLYLGQTLTIAGRYYFLDKSLQQLNLLDIAGETVGRVTVKSGEPFRLQVIPKAAGPVHYQLKSADHTLLADLHLYVQNGTQENTLIWASAPNAELNNLKNWLLADAQSVMTDIDISKNKTLTQKSDDGQNRDNSRLLVMDGRKLSRLNPVQLGSLENEVRAGKGLIVLADESLVDFAWLLKLGIELENYQSGEQNVQPFWLSDFQFEAALKVAELRFPDSDMGETLIRTGQGQTVAVKHRLGAGSIVISLLSDSFVLQREQQRTAYSRYWQTLISAALPLYAHGRILPQEPNVINHVNWRTKVCALVTSPEARLSIKSGTEQYAIPLTAAPQRDSMACGYFWPTQSGWYQLILENADVAHSSAVYAYEPDAFADIRAFQIHQTIDELNRRSSATPEKTETYYRPLTAYWFALLWLFSAAYLWWRKR
ncbi:hypothetical protein [Planctobacterium marinum]|uniref:hypothetical protein n=1 Tax=Planctobacterium marinum TaxID=1631968 RepID=UPI001E32A635|nr:hypothetical protein [Planctobacterium marinum]MCC2605666.1 hypothetical protein [Planctobacterium marinum]